VSQGLTSARLGSQHARCNVFRTPCEPAGGATRSMSEPGAEQQPRWPGSWSSIGSASCTAARRAAARGNVTASTGSGSLARPDTKVPCSPSAGRGRLVRVYGSRPRTALQPSHPSLVSAPTSVSFETPGPKRACTTAYLCCLRRYHDGRSPLGLSPLTHAARSRRESCADGSARSHVRGATASMRAVL